MRLPSVVPREGNGLTNAIDALRAIRYALEDARTAGPQDPLLAYQRWSNEAARRLSYPFESDDVERLILTRRHWALQGVFSSGVGDIRNLVHVEVEDRRRVLDNLLEDYEEINRCWPAAEVTLVAPDTNMYLHKKRPFDEIEWSKASGGDSVRLIVPELTVRELDRQKTYGKNVPVTEGSDERVPTRARSTVFKLRGYMSSPVAANPIRTRLEVEFLTNPLDHERLHDPDSEFIDRLLAMQRLVGQGVLVATADTGMKLIAEVNGLQVIEM